MFRRSPGKRFNEWIPAFIATLAGVAIAYTIPVKFAVAAALPMAAAPVLLNWPTRRWSGPYAYLALYAAGLLELVLLFTTILPDTKQDLSMRATMVVFSIFSLSAILTFAIRFHIATDKLMVGLGERITVMMLVVATYVPVNIAGFIE